MPPYLLLLLPLSLAILQNLRGASVAAAAHRRSLLRALGDGADLPDVAVDLNSTTFDDFLRESPASFAIVEFFAAWCPACRNYKSHYDKVARLFNGPDAVHPGIIVMTRVDCAKKTNTNLCDKFSVSHYPMLLWGPPHKFPNSQWDPKMEKSEIQYIDDWRTADRLLKWINEKMQTSFNIDDEKYENENLILRNASDPEQITRAIYDVEEATANAFGIILDHKMITSDARSPLIRFFQLLVAHHPSKRCRRGVADILVSLEDLWPLDHLSVNLQDANISHDKGGLDSFSICGKDIPRGYWIFCRGSKNETRGFSCGLWVLLHSLSVRVGDGESQITFHAMCDFVHNFFICEECRKHFHQMCLSVSTPINTTRALSLWLWGAHNKVNERLIKEEEDLKTGDPRFPKMIWPPKQLCPLCYQSSSLKESSSAVQEDWNEDEVFKFLVSYYGKRLVSSYQESLSRNVKQDEVPADDASASTNAVAVPVGAALAIALASCAFGALACFWRAQQKNRKYSHQLHSLKNI